MEDDVGKVLQTLTGMHRYKADVRSRVWPLLRASAVCLTCAVAFACWKKLGFPLTGLPRAIALSVTVLAMLLSIAAILLEFCATIATAFSKGPRAVWEDRLISERRHDYQNAQELLFLGRAALAKTNDWLGSLITRDERYLEAIVDNPNKLGIVRLSASLVAVAVATAAAIAIPASEKTLALDLLWPVALIALVLLLVSLFLLGMQLRRTHRRYMYYRDLIQLATDYSVNDGAV